MFNNTYRHRYIHIQIHHTIHNTILSRVICMFWVSISELDAIYICCYSGFLEDSLFA